MLSRERETADFLSRFGSPETALILGTGLGVMEESLNVHHEVAYGEIPNFPTSSVSSHAGKLIFATLGDRPVVAMSGRFHLYEGYSAREVTFPIRVFKLLGARRLFISNAAGGLRPDLSPGTPMLITDHINLTGRNPLIGPNCDELGPRFPDMTAPYAPRLCAAARDAARDADMALAEGVYVQIPGPSMETAAETRMLRGAGADAVGMSTVMEVISAVHCGLEVLAVSAITNNNDPDHYLPAPIEEVIANAEVAGPRIAAVFGGILRSLN